MTSPGQLAQVVRHYSQPDALAPFVAGHGFIRAELEWLAAQGALRRVLDEVYLPAASWHDRLARAAAVAALLPRRVAVGFEAAAWVWGGPLMGTVTVITTHGGAAMLGSASTRVVQQRRPPSVVRLHPAPGVPVKVTTPGRTLLDLIKAGRGTHGAAQFLRAAVGAEELQLLLERDRNTPGMACARAYLNANPAFTGPAHRDQPTSPPPRARRCR